MTPRIFFFNINGSGMGHMSRCLSYARQLSGRAEITFFSLACAVDIIEEMGFAAEYYVSQFWSTNSNYTWNNELAFRLSMLLEHVQPHIIVFDGTWPYHGFLGACMVYGRAKIVWSRRGLFKKDVKTPPIDPLFFDLILEPGELMPDKFLPVSTTDSEKEGASKNMCLPKAPTEAGNVVHLSPVTLLKQEELLQRAAARRLLGLAPQGQYALLSLGSGNVRDVHRVGRICIELLQKQGYTVLWARAPISVNDVPLPEGVIPLTMYPLVKVLCAFDVFVGAAGYNTCCEVVQAQVPSVLLPNALLADDQVRRAYLAAENSPTSVCLSEHKADIQKALEALPYLEKNAQRPRLNGAEEAAQALLQLAASPDAPKQNSQAHAWHFGPPWSYIVKHYTALARLKSKIWLGAKLHTLVNLNKAYQVLRPHAWQADLKHSPKRAQKTPQTVLLMAEGLEKEEQRELCQKVQGYLQQTQQYVPVLVTDTPDFAFFAKLHWLVEYLPHLQGRKEADYKRQKYNYLLWRYAGAVIMPLTRRIEDKYFRIR